MAKVSFYLFEKSPERQVESTCRLFNNQALDQFHEFSQIIEIIENNDSAKQLGREKFKQYRRLGIEPQTFKL